MSTRALGHLLKGVEAVDGPTFAGTAAFKVVTGLLASYLPARRPSSVDPVEAPRAD